MFNNKINKNKLYLSVNQMIECLLCLKEDRYFYKKHLLKRALTWFCSRYALCQAPYLCKIGINHITTLNYTYMYSRLLDFLLFIFLNSVFQNNIDNDMLKIEKLILLSRKRLLTNLKFYYCKRAKLC